MSNPENKFELPEVRPGLQETVPDAGGSRHDLPIPPDLVDDLIRQIDDGKKAPGKTEGDDRPVPPTIH